MKCNTDSGLSLHVFTEEKMGTNPYCDCGTTKNFWYPWPKPPKGKCRIFGHKYTYWYPVDSLLNWGKMRVHYCLRCGVEE